MRIRGGFLAFLTRVVGEKKKREKRGCGEESFFFVGSSWCVSGFYENLKIKCGGVVFHGVVSLE
jgi:hypothetical protein